MKTEFTMNQSFVIKGDICWSGSRTELRTAKNAYLVCENGKSAGVYYELPEKYSGLPLADYTDMLVIPGMADLHIHASQYAYRGLGMDLELLDWLQTYAFPEETRFADPEYAGMAYGIFADNMRRSATTRAAVFATAHTDATLILMDRMEQTGLVSLVGRVNMDRDAPDSLREPDAETSARETVRWIEASAGRYERTSPIITPRFLPSCTDGLLGRLGEISRRYGLPVQSHLSENPEEIKLVHRLFPDIRFYGEGYDRFGLFGGENRTIMAHCIYSSPAEIDLMKKNGVYAVHCPASNMNVASGIAPIRKYLTAGLNTGLGSDVAGGESESMFGTVSYTVQMSKLYWRLVDPDCAPLTFAEAFYLATAGGGSFLGKAGSFDEGYEFDAVVLDDRELCRGRDLGIAGRAERDVYLRADAKYIVGKYARGRKISLD